MENKYPQIVREERIFDVASPNFKELERECKEYNIANKGVFHKRFFYNTRTMVLKVVTWRVG